MEASTYIAHAERQNSGILREMSGEAKCRSLLDTRALRLDEKGGMFVPYLCFNQVLYYTRAIYKSTREREGIVLSLSLRSKRIKTFIENSNLIFFCEIFFEFFCFCY